MSFPIGNYEFEGPFESADELEDQAGIYAVMCERDDRIRLLDVGESAQVKTCIEGHEREPSWKKRCRGTLFFAVYYTLNAQEGERMGIEQEIREEFNPPCGQD